MGTIRYACTPSMTNRKVCKLIKCYVGIKQDHLGSFRGKICTANALLYAFPHKTCDKRTHRCDHLLPLQLSFYGLPFIYINPAGQSFNQPTVCRLLYHDDLSLSKGFKNIYEISSFLHMVSASIYVDLSKDKLSIRSKYYISARGIMF